MLELRKEVKEVQDAIEKYSADDSEYMLTAKRNGVEDVYACLEAGRLSSPFDSGTPYWGKRIGQATQIFPSLDTALEWFSQSVEYLLTESISNIRIEKRITAFEIDPAVNYEEVLNEIAERAELARLKEKYE